MKQLPASSSTRLAGRTPAAGELARYRVPSAPREVALIAVAAVTYGGVRALTEGRAEEARAHARALVRLEQALHIRWEGALQAPVLRHDTLVDLANWVYIFGHWPVIVTVGAFLYVRHRQGYFLLRNAMFISGAIGFLFFALLPVAPPRLLHDGLVDTVLQRSHSYRALQPPALTNEYASLPSLHFGWNLLVGIVLALTLRRPAAYVFAVLMPLAMGLAVIVTANHYVLDVVAGGTIVLLALAVALVAGSRASPPVSTHTLIDDETAVAFRRGAPSRQRRRQVPRGGLVGRPARRG